MSNLAVNIQFKPDLSQLSRKFQGFDKLLIKYLDEALLSFGLSIERESKFVTPVDTGRLRASIGVMNKSPLKIAIGTNVKYAIFVHEGTKFMKSRPFMKWGLNQTERMGKQIIERALQSAVNELKI